MKSPLDAKQQYQFDAVAAVIDPYAKFNGKHARLLDALALIGVMIRSVEGVCAIG